MNIFISWSGDRSKIVAEGIRELLALLIDSKNIFLSNHSIEKGSRGREAIERALNEDMFGIFCMTKENLLSPWMHYEAGAIAKAGPEARVWTLLLDVNPTDIQEPLAAFQHTDAAKREDLLKLVHEINNRLDPKKETLPLEKIFKLAWPEFEASTKQALEVPKKQSNGKGVRSDRELIEETLEYVRQISADNRRIHNNLSSSGVTSVDFAKQFKLTSNYDDQVSIQHLAEEFTHTLSRKHKVSLDPPLYGSNSFVIETENPVPVPEIRQLGAAFNLEVAVVPLQMKRLASLPSLKTRRNKAAHATKNVVDENNQPFGDPEDTIPF